MVNYRRNKNPGGTYFFTLTLQDRKSKIFIEQIDSLRKSFQQVKKENPFHIKAIVILPDHLHCIWELPDHDSDYSFRWKKIKTNFTKNIKRKATKLNKNKHGEHDLWQRRFWEHTIRNEKDLENHINYIHYNPVKHGLVMSVSDWPYSSFHKYVAEGLLDKNWGSANEYLENGNGFGE